mmetsp:Transcript_13162/g.11243  ORF Transcript_13162/g.11243 Transcript_13162/m.11243 type:complete len:86 (+) Transcript_13162:3-260(+)
MHKEISTKDEKIKEMESKPKEEPKSAKKRPSSASKKNKESAQGSASKEPKKTDELKTENMTLKEMISHKEEIIASLKASEEYLEK